MGSQDLDIGGLGTVTSIYNRKPFKTKKIKEGVFNNPILRGLTNGHGDSPLNGMILQAGFLRNQKPGDGVKRTLKELIH